MRIAICDDQVQYRTQIVTAIRDLLRKDGVLVDPYKNGFDFLRGFEKNPYDLVFLDIEMPEINGIQVAKKLRQIHKDVPIVFLTSHIEYALEGYEVSALRYLTKPISIPKLQEVLSYVQQQLQEQRFLWVKTELGEEKVLINEILYMESQNQNVNIVTTEDTYSVRYNLGDYESELADDGFMRIHRGYLVSLGNIKSVGRNEIVLVDGSSLPVSRSKEKPLKDALFQYIRKEAF